MNNLIEALALQVLIKYKYLYYKPQEYYLQVNIKYFVQSNRFSIVFIKTVITFFTPFALSKLLSFFSAGGIYGFTCASHLIIKQNMR